MNQNERLLKLADRRLPRIQKINRNTVRNFTQHISEVAELAHEGPLPIRAEQDVPRIVSRPLSSAYLRLGDILPKHHFLTQLQREKSRTDRSKAPLSVALFSPNHDRSDVKGLLELLRDSTRETDILGYLGEDRIALLLPDTNEQGAQRLTQKIVDRANDLPISAITRTYPDQLFDSLIAENQGLPDDAYPLLFGASPDRAERGYLLKRSLDIVGAIVGILLLSPVMLIAALAVAVSSTGPVIYRQVRLGKKGVPFVFYKFRSMYCNVDDRIHREYVTSLIKGDVQGANQGDAMKPMYKLKSDPRITRVGQIIRKTSIDELPQLFNVLKGDMSLVGPRPALAYEVETYQSWHLRRLLQVRPGITGLWQVEGRSKTTFDEMVRLDLRYIENCSLILDLKILLKTVKVVLNCDGAS